MNCLHKVDSYGPPLKQPSHKYTLLTRPQLYSCFMYKVSFRKKLSSRNYAQKSAETLRTRGRLNDKAIGREDPFDSIRAVGEEKPKVPSSSCLLEIIASLEITARVVCGCVRVLAYLAYSHVFFFFLFADGKLACCVTELTLPFQSSCWQTRLHTKQQGVVRVYA